MTYQQNLTQDGTIQQSSAFEAQFQGMSLGNLGKFHIKTTYHASFICSNALFMQSLCTLYAPFMHSSCNDPNSSKPNHSFHQFQTSKAPKNSSPKSHHHRAPSKKPTSSNPTSPTIQSDSSHENWAFTLSPSNTAVNTCPVHHSSSR